MAKHFFWHWNSWLKCERKKRFCPFSVSQRRKEANVRTILKLPDVPITIFDRNSPILLRVVSNMKTPKNFGVPRQRQKIQICVLQKT